MKTDFIPINMDEAKRNGWKYIDVVIVTCDAYIDHPWYEAVRSARVLISSGFKVGIVSDPTKEDLAKFGKPRLFFLVITGKEDSMVMNYSAYKKYRSSDPYQSGGKRSNRPDRAAITLTSNIRSHFKDAVVVLGGNEASTRRVTHYDYWSNKLRKPILFDSKADLLIFDKIELNCLRLAKHMRGSLGIETLYNQPGIAYISKEEPLNMVKLPSHEDCEKDKVCYVDMYRIFLSELNFSSKGIYQKVMNRYMVINRLHKPYTEDQMIDIFSQSYKNRPHFIYKEPIPIFEKLLATGIVTQIGDPVNLNFNSFLTEGKDINKRPFGGIIKDSHRIKKLRSFKATFKNIGYGKMEQMAIELKNRIKCEDCKRYTCFETAGKSMCSNIVFNEQKYIDLLKTISESKSVRQILDSTTIDYRVMDKCDDIIKDYIKLRTGMKALINSNSFSDKVRRANDLEESKQLKGFITKYIKKSGEYGKNRSLEVVLNSSLPGETFETVKETLKYVMDNELIIGEVRPFIPLPLTVQSVVYYSEKNIFSFEDVDVIKDTEEKKLLEKILNFQKKGKRKDLKYHLKRKKLNNILNMVEKYEASEL
ncbi:MAG: hypothetical protein CR982_02295 [Candidatus Cloacimonadota bacterium]|nr:MAG: hypothetical protein CR982_02295 [Candidatus Cloacimonadota bacterium]PIE81098.1 MAG: hypothetical protein CSA15_01095 [Candidatus Delongbacteria bacterium]